MLLTQPHDASVVMVAILELSTVHVASVRGRPNSSMAVNCCVAPTRTLALAGLICSETGRKRRELCSKNQAPEPNGAPFVAQKRSPLSPKPESQWFPLSSPYLTASPFSYRHRRAFSHFTRNFHVIHQAFRSGQSHAQISNSRSHFPFATSSLV